jgi:hypothetical protein
MWNFSHMWNWNTSHVNSQQCWTMLASFEQAFFGQTFRRTRVFSSGMILRVATQLLFYLNIRKWKIVHLLLKEKVELVIAAKVASVKTGIESWKNFRFLMFHFGWDKIIKVSFPSPANLLHFIGNNNQKLCHASLLAIKRWTFNV